MKDDLEKNMDDILLSNYTPSGVIMNEQLDIVQFHGSVREFLDLQLVSKLEYFIKGA